jgi:cell division protein FtsQ
MRPGRSNFVSRIELNPPQARSWRDIPQQVKPRAMSPEGRRRVVWGGMKTVFGVVLLGALAWGGYEVTAALRGKPKQLTAAEAVPVKEIDFGTDGVLPKTWVVETLALRRGASLMELDLYRLRERLLACSQVRSATLTRTFPATLTVNISEQSPVARVMARVGEGEPQMFLVARDGTVFEGIGFDAGLIETLPWLDGMKLTRADDTFEPIPDMPTVADLLAKAKLEAEHLYREWQVVSLARLASDGEIEVRSTSVARILFGTNEDFFRQLARLDSLIDAARAHTEQPLREVNLAIGAHVPVAFEGPTLVPNEGGPGVVHAPAGAAAKWPAIPAFPHFQPKTKL